MVNYDGNVDFSNIKDKLGNNILHSAILETWSPGVCIALENGIDVLSKVSEI